jgi:hypothetical protein
MKTLLIRISDDPRRCPRPAEAVRIAAGLGAWKKVRVDLSFEGPALECLSEFPEDLEGGDLLVQYLPAIAKHGGTIYPAAPEIQSDYVMEFEPENAGSGRIDPEALLDRLFPPA